METIHLLFHWCIGGIGSIVIAWAAFKKGSLSRSGALAAVGIGSILYALGNWYWIVPMLAFFISSSWLTKFKRKVKANAEEMYEKSGPRDAGQVMANGGAAALICLVNVLLPNELWWVFYIGIIAAVTADTWATEIGGLSRTAPISLRTFRKAVKGDSGAVSMIGLNASLGAGLFIALITGLLNFTGSGFHPLQNAFPQLVLVCIVSGALGALIDSLLGAYVQLMYRCGICGNTIEKSIHCDAPAERVRGMKLMNNDGVNSISSLFGGLIAVFMYMGMN